MNDLLTWARQNQEMLTIGGWWLYSSAMSQMPPLPSNAGFFLRWFHDTAQFLAANPAKFSNRNPAQPGKEP